jgi:hypothetical protein
LKQALVAVLAVAALVTVVVVLLAVFALVMKVVGSLAVFVLVVAVVGLLAVFVLVVEVVGSLALVVLVVAVAVAVKVYQFANYLHCHEGKYFLYYPSDCHPCLGKYLAITELILNHSIEPYLLVL